MRVLHMFTNPHLTNGATMFEYRVSSYLKEKDIFFDYLVTEEAENEELERYKSMGSKVYKLPIDNKHGLIIRELKVNVQYYKFFKKHRYDIVYADTENALRSIHLLMARFAGVPVRVVHSHNTGLQTESRLSKKISRLMRGCFRLSANNYFACSDLAAEWLFPKKIYQERNYKLLTNGVNLEEFEFNRDDRISSRKKLNINEDELVIGNVGRFMPQKNHVFLVKIFQKIHANNPKSRLLLIGNGPLLDEIKTLVIDMELQDAVIFVGTTADVVKYLQAMDVFLMPSLFEGLPITGIEAQANGLPCIFSDTITKELAITPLAQYCSLKCSADDWMEVVFNAAQKGRRNCKQEIIESGYSILDTVSFLEKFYSKYRR